MLGAGGCEWDGGRGAGQGAVDDGAGGAGGATAAAAQRGGSSAVHAARPARGQPCCAGYSARWEYVGAWGVLALDRRGHLLVHVWALLASGRACSHRGPMLHPTACLTCC